MLYLYTTITVRVALNDKEILSCIQVLKKEWRYEINRLKCKRTYIIYDNYISFLFLFPDMVSSLICGNDVKNIARWNYCICVED